MKYFNKNNIRGFSVLGFEVGLHEGFFQIVPNKEIRDEIAMEPENNDGKYKRGKGSQKQATVLVMAGSTTVGPTKKYRYRPNKKVRYIKMKPLLGLSKETANLQVKQAIDERSTATTNGGK